MVISWEHALHAPALRPPSIARPRCVHPLPLDPHGSPRAHLQRGYRLVVRGRHRERIALLHSRMRRRGRRGGPPPSLPSLSCSSCLSSSSLAPARPRRRSAVSAMAGRTLVRGIDVAGRQRLARVSPGLPSRPRRCHRSRPPRCRRYRRSSRRVEIESDLEGCWEVDHRVGPDPGPSLVVCSLWFLSV
jgi:hypothetical protein